MSWRTVIITGRCKLDFKMGYLVVRGEKKIKVIFCDSKRSPAAELVPCHGSHDSSLKIRTQAAWSADIKAAVWREIISEKIRRQAGLLCELSHTREAELLSSYIPQVELMDSTNREGHAAKVYFQTPDLFAWTAVIVAVSVAFEHLFLAAVDALVRKVGR